MGTAHCVVSAWTPPDPGCAASQRPAESILCTEMCGPGSQAAATAATHLDEAMPSVLGSGGPADPIALGTHHQIVHEGVVWKLNNDADPAKAESWIKRRMWLTAMGGLFHDGEGSGQDRPCGCQVGGLIVREPFVWVKDRYTFELRAPGVGQAGTGVAMVLAVPTQEEREAWVRCFAHFEGPANSGTSLSPLDIFSKGTFSRRRSQTLPGLLSVQKVATAPTTCRSSMDSADGGQEEDGLEWTATVSWRNSPGVQGNPYATIADKARRNSQLFYAEKLHTSLLLDWDDTIFPTTWIRKDCGMNWRLPLACQLQPGPRKNLINDLFDKLLDRTVEFLMEAARYANIFIVTLSRRPWVEMSQQNFMPGLGGLFQQMGLKVIYAQEYADSSFAREYHQEEFHTSEETKAFWTRVKSQAIARELGEFHQHNNVSWKNILSLGDSDFERYGTISAGEDYMRREMEGSEVWRTGVTPDGYTHTSEGVSREGQLRRLRTKTVKLLSEPTIEELMAELALLKRWLPHMVQQDGGFDIEIFGSDDNEQLRELDRQVTGECADITWEKLVGMGPMARKS